ncbi:hypothetical protein J3996_gp26 [Mycobacterium phage Laurie]|uniref:Tail assembly chaperone n=1 Tax=Mycobacterium phage Laurie TaxID=1874015 RepID=A0A1B2IHQ6_9CAUD|nr:hypothetical protein J3996_gp26 [Mycobacterium phage Laurie]ANZ52320.1 hypothetical protein SEA_LAURIE_26 [Mycobacterium phage Laurie]
MEVTVEGTLTPSVYLGTGERQRVELTQEVRRKISRGYIKIVAYHDTDPVTPEPTEERLEVPEAVPPTPEAVAPKPPARNASRDDWAEFLASFPDNGFVTEGKDRAALIAEWDEYLENS